MIPMKLSRPRPKRACRRSYRPKGTEKQSGSTTDMFINPSPGGECFSASEAMAKCCNSVCKEIIVLSGNCSDSMPCIMAQNFVTTLSRICLRSGFGEGIGAPLMKDGLKRMINGLEDNNLGVFGSCVSPNQNAAHTANQSE